MRWPLPLCVLIACAACTAQPTPITPPTGGLDASTSTVTGPEDAMVADATELDAGADDAGAVDSGALGPDTGPPAIDAGASDAGDTAMALAAAGARALDVVLPLVQLAHAVTDTGTAAQSAAELAAELAAQVDLLLEGCAVAELMGARVDVDLPTPCAIGPTLVLGQLRIEVARVDAERIRLRLELAGRVDGVDVRGTVRVTSTGTGAPSLDRELLFQVDGAGVAIAGPLVVVATRLGLAMDGELTAGTRALAVAALGIGYQACFPSAGTVTVGEGGASVELSASLPTTTSGDLAVSSGGVVALGARTACGMGGRDGGGGGRDGGGGRRDGGPRGDGGGVGSDAQGSDAVSIDPDGGVRGDGGNRRDR